MTAVFLRWLMAATWASTAANAVGVSEQFELRHTCPASFEKLPDGTCAFRSLYQLYTLPEGHGGLRAPLPPHRDGFSPEQIDLGRYLFFDPVLSADHSISCATCHNPDYGFADGRGRSLGRGAAGYDTQDRRGGSLLQRGAPSLWNAGFLKRFFWDGRADSLEDQARGPLLSADEMGTSPTSVVQALNSVQTYRRLFAVGFQRPAEQPITFAELTTALAAFETSLISLNSRYDRYAHGDGSALSAQEMTGLNVFRGFVARCSQCHTPPLFTNSEIAVVGAPGVPGQGYDRGVGQLDPNPEQLGAFKIPTLRNIARTGPYFNAGQFTTLVEVVDFYNAGRGHAVPAGLHENIHWHIAMTRPQLSGEDTAALVAFLGSLTDESLCPPVPATVPSGLPVIHTHGPGLDTNNPLGRIAATTADHSNAK